MPVAQQSSSGYAYENEYDHETKNAELKKITKIHVARSNWNLKKNSPTAHSRELSEPVKEGITLKKDVFYGRAIIQLPLRYGFLGVSNLEGTLNPANTDAKGGNLKKQLEEFPYSRFNITGENSKHVVQSSLCLIAESRLKEQSRFFEYLQLVKEDKMLVFTLSETQKKMLNGTTQEATPREMDSFVDMVVEAAGNFSLPVLPPEDAGGSASGQTAGVSRKEAEWAISVILTRALTIWPPTEDRPGEHPGGDSSDQGSIKMQIVPLPELLYANYHPDGNTAITFQEERIVEKGTEVDVVLQIARRDMAKGEENFLYPGRLSNSDLLLRYNLTFSKNHVGIGDNSSYTPGSLVDVGEDDARRMKSKQRKEFERFNCTAEDFELRFSPKGYPSRRFTRCWRVNWFMDSGWYTPGLLKKVHWLDKWPPPSAYTGEELWLAFTQADNAMNALFKNHCAYRRARLRSGIDRGTLDEFKLSSNIIDQKLFKLRTQETKTFRNCEELAHRISNTDSSAPPPGGPTVNKRGEL
eukprot:g10744.t1